MKKTFFLAGLAIISGLLFQSCASNKDSFSVPKEDMVKQAREARESELPCFVQWNDGSFSFFNSLTLSTGVFKEPRLLADDELEISSKQIIAYQNEEHYAISQEHFKMGRKSIVAVETLPGFAIRVAKGKLNVYSAKFNKGQHSYDQYYVQDGDKGPILACTNEFMSELLQKDPTTFDFVYSQMSGTAKNKKLQQLASLQKTNQGLTRNK